MRTIRIIVSLGLVGILLIPEQVYAWCFMLPDAISYGPNTYGDNAGPALSRKDAPDVADLMGGRILMANIRSTLEYDVKFTFEDGSTKTMTLLLGQAIGLTTDGTGYFVMQATPMLKDMVINPETDQWAPGNWAYDKQQVWLIETRNGRQGAYLRLNQVAAAPFSAGKPVKVDLPRMLRLDLSNGNTTLFENSTKFHNASENPFSTEVFKSLPIVDDCKVVNACGVDPHKKPLRLDWVLKRED